jgi:hypothetical protein
MDRLGCAEVGGFVRVRLWEMRGLVVAQFECSGAHRGPLAVDEFMVPGNYGGSRR